MSDLKKYLDDCCAAVEKTLDEVMPKATDYPQKIHEIMRYSTFAGGKRIRPALLFAANQACGAEFANKNACLAGAAIEMLHTFSLIHDDLPCMDNDDMRRGKPTCHKVFGEAVAVLAGDALLTRAFEVMADHGTMSAQDRVWIISNVAGRTGARGMIGGQVLDMLYEGGCRAVNLEDLRYMCSFKTGALMNIAVDIAMATCRPDSEKQTKIFNFTRNLGLAFQIRDDILDLIGDAESLGKNIGMDIERGKATFVTVLGLEGAAELLEQLTNEAIAEISHFGDKAQFLIDLTNYLLNREN